MKKNQEIPNKYTHCLLKFYENLYDAYKFIEENTEEHNKINLGILPSYDDYEPYYLLKLLSEKFYYFENVLNRLRTNTHKNSLLISRIKKLLPTDWFFQNNIKKEFFSKVFKYIDEASNNLQIVIQLQSSVFEFIQNNNHFIKDVKNDDLFIPYSSETARFRKNHDIPEDKLVFRNLNSLPFEDIQKIYKLFENQPMLLTNDYIVFDKNPNFYKLIKILISNDFYSKLTLQNSFKLTDKTINIFLNLIDNIQNTAASAKLIKFIIFGNFAQSSVMDYLLNNFILYYKKNNNEKSVDAFIDNYSRLRKIYNILHIDLYENVSEPSPELSNIMSSLFSSFMNIKVKDKSIDKSREFLNLLDSIDKDVKILSNTKLRNDIVKVINKNINNINKYVENIFYIYKICFIYKYCNKDINYLYNKINITTQSNEFNSLRYLLGNIILSNSFSKINTPITETRLLSILSKLPKFDQIIHSCVIDHQKISDYMILTNIDTNSNAVKSFLKFFGQNLNPLNKSEEMVKERLAIINKDFNEFKNQIKFYEDIYASNKPINSSDQNIVSIYKYSLIIDALQYYKQYKNQQKPKINVLNELNLTLPDNYKFKVLKDNDVEYFTIGAETNCCQVIGGAGSNAAIDSFINPEASVLILESDKGDVLAQSYFHYVPKDNGFILDNVEINSNNVKKLGFKFINGKADLDEFYSILAEKLLSKGFKYLKCGLGYNMLAGYSFKTIKNPKEKDIRRFDTEEKYSDFSPNKYLLLTSLKTEIKGFTNQQMKNKEERKLLRQQQKLETFEIEEKKMLANMSPAAQRLYLKNKVKEQLKKYQTPSLTQSLKNKIVEKYSK